jgi:hypothetical protein
MSLLHPASFLVCLFWLTGGEEVVDGIIDAVVAEPKVWVQTQLDHRPGADVRGQRINETQCGIGARIEHLVGCLTKIL